MKTKSLKWLLPVLAGVLFFCVLLAIKFGPVEIPLDQSFKVIVNRVTGMDLFAKEWKNSTENIIWNMRLPRILLAAIIGGCLSLSGVSVQALTNNPLANPYLMGVSSGASVGAVGMILFGDRFEIGRLGIAGGAFVGALVAVAIVLLLVRRMGGFSSVQLVLTGVAVSSMFGALTSLMVFSAKDARSVRTALFWMTGSFAGAKWEYVVLMLPILVIGFLMLWYCHRELDALVLGEEHAQILGVNTVLYRRLLIGVVTLLTSVAVSMTGVIGFVGLIIPHFIRLIAGSTHKRVLPLVLLVGAIFMVLADLFSKVVFAPEEIPIGVITALIGAPCFLWMMQRKRYQFGGK